jgi:hypothetical protein
MTFETSLALTFVVGWTMIIVGWAGQYFIHRINKP